MVLRLLPWCSYKPPKDALDHFNNDMELWLKVIRVKPYDADVKELSPKNLRVDRDFLIRLVRAADRCCLAYLTREPQLDFDLIVAACSTNTVFADDVAYDCLVKYD